MKRILLFFFITFQFVQAQDFSNEWEAFFSYTSLVDIVENNGKIYAAAQNSIFIYDDITGEIETLTTVNGLSAQNISEIYYSPTRDILVVGFENGLLQLVFDDNSVRTIVAVRDKIVIPPDDKRINEFLERGDLLYIATDFGIALYNLDLLEFDDTYFIGDGGSQLVVNSIAIEGTNIYAATNGGGIRVASITNPFLLDFTNWTQVNADIWESMTSFNNRVYAITQGRFVASSNGVGAFSGLGFQLPSRARDAFINNDRIAYATRDFIVIYDNGLNEIFRVGDINGESFTYTSVVLLDDILYASTEEAGLLRLNITIPGSEEFIVADGPLLNNTFSVNALPSELWVTHGEHTLFYNPFPLNSRGVSYLFDGAWDNYEFDEVFSARSISSVTINPENKDEVFLNSMYDGVVRIENGVATDVFDENNSTLVPVFSNSGNPAGVRVSESAFDSQGNLWVLNAFADNMLNRRSPSGQWTGIDVSPFNTNINGEAGSNAIIVDTRDRIIFGTINNGVIAYDPSTNEFSGLIDQIQQGDLINPYIAALRIDQRGQLWIGSNLGLRVLFSASSIFSDDITDTRPIIIEDVNGIPRELLADEAVLDIEIDGNNNKWVATGSSGVFLFNPSGRETLLQFTTANSPLPDDEVRDISIDATTGLVYFATKNGLVAYRGTRSSDPQDNLENVYAFPNPVRPGFEGNVTIDGLTNRARVKITDIEGNLVYEEVSQGGSIQWDTRSFAGDKVRSGVYMLFISTQDNIETTVSKIMIIR